jgi:hypothetical protein
VPTVEVCRDDEANWVVALVAPEPGLDAGKLAGSQAVAAVEDEDFAVGVGDGPDGLE